MYASVCTSSHTQTSAYLVEKFKFVFSLVEVARDHVFQKLQVFRPIPVVGITMGCHLCQNNTKTPYL